MTKEILIQCYDLQNEIKDIEKRISKLKLQRETVIKDSVKGSASYFPYTPTTFKIEGVGNHSSKDKQIRRYQKLLKEFNEKLLELKISVEEYIESLPSSRHRRILRLKYLDGMSWTQIAHELGGDSTADSVRMEFKRFFKKK